MLQGWWTTFALVLALCTAAAAQQKYPSRNIDLIIPFAVGGGVDLIARAMGASLASNSGRRWLRSIATARPARWASPSLRAPRPTAT